LLFHHFLHLESNNPLDRNRFGFREYPFFFQEIIEITTYVFVTILVEIVSFLIHHGQCYFVCPNLIWCALSFGETDYV